MTNQQGKSISIHHDHKQSNTYTFPITMIFSLNLVLFNEHTAKGKYMVLIICI